GIIPAKALKEACKKVPKGRLVASQPILGHLAIVLAPNQATFASTDLDEATSGLTRLVEGKFPPCDDVFPKQKDEVVRVRLNPEAARGAVGGRGGVRGPRRPEGGVGRLRQGQGRLQPVPRAGAGEARRPDLRRADHAAGLRRTTLPPASDRSNPPAGS